MTGPRFSIIVPTRDRDRELRRCLGSLAALEPPAGGFEVIVVDDGSREPPEEAVTSWRGSLEVSLHRQPNRGPASARNVGAARARGKLLAFIDDDIALSPPWLVAMDRAARSQPTAALGGAVEPPPHAGRCAIASELIVTLATGRPSEPRATTGADGALRFLPTNNLVVPADEFARVGGLHPAFRVSEDREFCRRWRRNGRTLAFVEDARSTHFKELTVAGFLRQHYRYGKGAFRYQQGAGDGSPLEMIEPAFYRRVLDEAARALRRGELGSVALLALWQLANSAGYLAAAIRSAVAAQSPQP